MKKIISFLFLILISSTLFAKTVEVEAIGEGQTKDLAVFNALDNALRQYEGVSITRDTPVSYSEREVNYGHKQTGNDTKDNKSFELSLNGKSIKDEISVRYGGKIPSYKIVSTEQVNKKYIVKIVAQFDKVDDYTEGKLAQKKEYSIALPVFFSKQIPLCNDDSCSTEELLDNITFDVKEGLSATRKFKLLDRQNFEATAEELSLITSDITKREEAKRLHSVISADYILVGAIRKYDQAVETKHIAVTGEDKQTLKANLAVEISLIETATMEDIYSFKVEKKIEEKNSIKSCSEAFDLLASQVTKEIVTKVRNRLVPKTNVNNSTLPSKTSVKKRTSQEVNTQKVETKEEVRPKVKLPFDK